MNGVTVGLRAGSESNVQRARRLCPFTHDIPQGRSRFLTSANHVAPLGERDLSHMLPKRAISARNVANAGLAL